MLLKVGVSPEHHLILGHRSLKSFGSFEVYARDVQAASLRTLCRMFQDIREGLFCSDAGLVLDDLDPTPSQQVDETGARRFPFSF